MIIYLLLGAHRGYRRGVGAELKSFISTLMILSMLSGVWLFTVLREFVAALLKVHPVTGGLTGAVLAIVITIFLFRLLRTRLPESVQSSMDDGNSAKAGMSLGLLRRSLVGGFCLFLCLTAPLDIIRTTIIEHSQIAAVLSRLPGAG